MFSYNSNFSVNKHIDNVFKSIYDVPEDYSRVSPKDNDKNIEEDDDDDDNDNEIDNDINSQVAVDRKDSTNINANLYKIIEWNINNNWDIINGRRRKIESIYIYVNDFPTYLKDVVVEDANYIRMRRKHTIMND